MKVFGRIGKRESRSKKCEYCGNIFKPSVGKENIQRFCRKNNDQCRKRWHRREDRRKNGRESEYSNNQRQINTSNAFKKPTIPNVEYQSFLKNNFPNLQEKTPKKGRKKINVNLPPAVPVKYPSLGDIVKEYSNDVQENDKSLLGATKEAKNQKFYNVLEDLINDKVEEWKSYHFLSKKDINKKIKELRANKKNIDKAVKNLEKSIEEDLKYHSKNKYLFLNVEESIKSKRTRGENDIIYHIKNELFSSLKSIIYV